ncbi:hypothetical protein HMI55_004134 [Coelomomyces lativittatus]|nr:hypothetical protein HMI55_004134 [Coelomomyces lativittatus]
MEERDILELRSEEDEIDHEVNEINKTWELDEYNEFQMMDYEIEDTMDFEENETTSSGEMGNHKIANKKGDIKENEEKGNANFEQHKVVIEQVK